MLSPVPWPSWPGQWLGLGRRRRSSCQPSSIIYWTTLKQMWQIIVSAIVKNILDHSETYVTGHFVIHPQKYTGPVLNRFTGYRISHPQNYTGPLWNRFTGNGVSHHKLHRFTVKKMWHIILKVYRTTLKHLRQVIVSAILKIVQYHSETDVTGHCVISKINRTTGI